MKTCTKCGIEKPRTVEYFAKQKSGRDGFCASCKECRKIYMRRYWQLNDYKKEEYIENNKEKITEYRKQYWEDNKEKLSKQKSEWRKANAEKIRITKQQRRAKKEQLPATLTKLEWNKIKLYFNYSCAYCGITEKEHLKQTNERLHQEHFVSVGNGGEYTHNNIVPSCRACNSSKGEKLFSEWYSAYKYYNKERENKILEFLGHNEKQEQQLTLIL